MITATIAQYLKETKIPLRLAAATASGWPIVLSLWYLYEDGLLYCATQADARIVAYLKEEPRCGFEVAGDLPPYCGVRGQATATIDEAKGEAMLRLLLVRYLGGLESSLADLLLGRADNEVAICLEPKTVTTWDFTSRMKDSVAVSAGKLCP